MNMILDKHIAVVTGASRGIGRAIAMQLAQQGATVIGTATSQGGADSISEALKEVNATSRGAVLDVTDAAAADAFIDSIIKEFGALNVLVNNAGITKDQLAMRMKDDEFDAVIDTNLRAVFRLSRAVLRTHHQHYVGGRVVRQSGPGQLRGGESRRGGHDPRAGP
jgi:3-oxoacyl-[acyl-carrier protein] reductase